jgi:NADPH-dependent ferric siderophore reductase
MRVQFLEFKTDETGALLNRSRGIKFGVNYDVTSPSLIRALQGQGDSSEFAINDLGVEPKGLFLWDHPDNVGIIYNLTNNYIGLYQPGITMLVADAQSHPAVNSILNTLAVHADPKQMRVTTLQPVEQSELGAVVVAHSSYVRIGIGPLFVNPAT